MWVLVIERESKGACNADVVSAFACGQRGVLPSVSSSMVVVMLTTIDLNARVYAGWVKMSIFVVWHGNAMFGDRSSVFFFAYVEDDRRRLW